MLTVVTTCTRDYQRPWCFPSLGMLSCRVVCLLQPDDDRPLPRDVERHPYETPGVLYQNGSFLSAVPRLSDDDLIVLADADGVFQRDFSADELNTLGDLQNGFALGYNVRPGQRGEEEYELLRPKQPLDRAATMLGVPQEVLRGCWVYNTGFMAGRVAEWKRLRRLYAETFGERGPGMFELHSWMQYFLCMTFCLHGVPITELGFESHSHGHFPLTRLHTAKHRQLYYNGKRVLYAHNLPGVSH